MHHLKFLKAGKTWWDKGETILEPIGIQHVIDGFKALGDFYVMDASFVVQVPLIAYDAGAVQ
jgi:hypothetical protein